MQAIVCVSENWGIGFQNDLLFHIHADLKRFREKTTGKTVIMGHKTLLSFPGQKPLPNRRNIVLTRQNISIDGAEVAHSVEEAALLGGEDAMVIGGGTVYERFLPYCDRVLVTKVDANVPSDTYFPDLDRDPAWEIAAKSEQMEENGLFFRYIDYIRR